MSNDRYRTISRLASGSVGLILVGALACSSLSQETSDSQTRGAEEFFESRIRPILIDRCVSCHGAEKQWAELRLDRAESAMRGGESGPVLVAGKPTESELYRRIIETDGEVRMPPDESGPALTEQQIAWFREWIEQGAVWPQSREMKGDSADDVLRKHWAFQPLSEAEPPRETSSPTGEQDRKNPIDAFVDAKRKEMGLPKSPQADPRTLLRRAHYDITGLPPSFASVESLASNFSVEAWERSIDTLLSDPSFGEHWGRLWLDIARYSDTKGYVYAREERFYVHAPLYRDWVIQAWNQGMRFDRFLELQVAADCLPDSQKQDWVALGFLTLGRRFLGVESDIIDDRIDVVSRGMLGLTVGCARCHDHKYDPISTADYYSLFGIFQNSHEQLVALSDEKEQSGDRAKNLEEKKEAYKVYLRTQKEEAEARIRDRIADYLMAQRSLSEYPDVSFSQLSSKEDLLPAIVHRWENYLHRASRLRDPLFLPWIELNGIEENQFEAESTVRIARWKEVPGTVHPAVLQSLSNAPSSIKELANRYEEILLRAWRESKSESGANDALHGRTLRKEFGEEAWESMLGFLTRSESPCVIPTEHMANMEWLWDNGTVVELWKRQSEVERLLLEDPLKHPHAVVLQDNPSTFEPRIFRRGNPATKGADVDRGLPRVLGRASEHHVSSGSGRLALAKGVIDPRNPLTARVWVNRVWKQYFGAGLVKTPSDFGVRATPPSHPELLDYLAREFMAHGWDNRWLHRLILTSETYQQTSLGPERDSDGIAAQGIDPENRYLWRMNRKRVTFEVLRDSMLAASGRLEISRGGKSQDLFVEDGIANRRRTIYGTIDRQYLPTVLSVFDFANPDMHAPERNETTVPQQALFALNHPFVAAQARGVVAELERHPPDGIPRQEFTSRLDGVFERVLQRRPTEDERKRLTDWFFEAEKMVTASDASQQAERMKAWSYGFGQIDAPNNRLLHFTELPYKTSTHRQGGEKLPDAKLGWVHITARTIHTGNDLQHSAVRRWTSPGEGSVSIRSIAKHVHGQGDGVRGILLSSRHGILKSQVVAHGEETFHIEDLAVQEGDTIDFIAELHGSLSYEDLDWVPDVTWTPIAASASPSVVRHWNGADDFPRSLQIPLSPMEQLAQMLLVSNEAFFVD
ncbi:PSD1 and planctomycete cytochrome C domain-containing protein [Pirellulaceae bacterium SH467]